MFDINTNFKHLSLKSSDRKVFKIMRNLNSFMCVQTFVYITTILDQYQKPPLLFFSFVVSLSTATFIPTVHMKRKRTHTHKNSTGATGFCIWSAVKAKPLKHFDKHTPLVLQVKWSAGQYGPAPSLENTQSSSARPPQIKGFSLSLSLHQPLIGLPQQLPATQHCHCPQKPQPY